LREVSWCSEGCLVLYENEKLETRIVKSKAIPLQAWTGPESFRRMRLPDFQTFGT